MDDGRPERRTCMVIDLKDYSSLTGAQKFTAQGQLDAALREAAAATGLRRLTWGRQPSGDGEFAVLPVGESDRAVVGAFPLAIDVELRRQCAEGGLLLRARMAVSHGAVKEGPLGYAEQAPVDVARMAAAPPLRRALGAHDDARLAIAVSHDIYRDVVSHGGTAIPQDQFVRTEAASIQADMWVAAIGVDRAAVVAALKDPEATGQTASSGDRYSTSIGSVSTRTFHIGPNRG